MQFKETLHQLAKRAKEQIEILYEIGKNPDTPLLAKIIVIAALAYALSPIDIIPDFIPILGYLDDLIILPILIFIAYKLIPKNIWNKAQQKARSRTEPLPKNWYMAIFIILFWAVMACYLIYILI
ncbi:DUF1232 domain-containing protein [Legionella impletisoli]|uniref:DUF1232 domain-containing protein n=1 Tax=Legionella impletisoli TaxID=343510 RepID=A0A917JX85_9GAMM|nr:DUF1232 domain-containing protein [Legionella impletisoli]GGI90819.1 hypothetical protein GCM10007966_19400 [Legionella impletisoli]